jgi:hypothetical protein
MQNKRGLSQKKEQLPYLNCLSTKIYREILKWIEIIPKEICNQVSLKVSNRRIFLR